MTQSFTQKAGDLCLEKLDVENAHKNFQHFKIMEILVKIHQTIYHIFIQTNFAKKRSEVLNTLRSLTFFLRSYILKV